MRQLTGGWRMLRILGHILWGLWIAAVRLPRLQPSQQSAQVQAWALSFLGHAGIALEIRGQPPITGPMLLVANHLSWLDIPVLHAARYCRFVSKADVQDWPLIGTLATAAGTLYIERSSRRDALRMVHQMRDALCAGVSRRHDRRRPHAAALSCQLAAGGAGGPRASAAGGLALYRPGQRPDQPCAQFHRQ